MRRREMARYDEDKINISCVSWFKLQYPKIVIHHSPNECRSPREGAKRKAMGVWKGFPDLFIPLPLNGYCGLFVEIKTPIGRQSKEQKEFELWCEEHNYKYSLVRSLDDFIVVVKDYIRE